MDCHDEKHIGFVVENSFHLMKYLASELNHTVHRTVANRYNVPVVRSVSYIRNFLSMKKIKI